MVLIPPARGVSLKRADGTVVTKGFRGVIRPVYREEFVASAMTRDFAERDWHWFSEKGTFHMKYPILNEQRLATGYRSRQAASEVAQKSLTPGA